jgi:hypothetical protein
MCDKSSSVYLQFIYEGQFSNGMEYYHRYYII